MTRPQARPAGFPGSRYRVLTVVTACLTLCGCENEGRDGQASTPADSEASGASSTSTRPTTLDVPSAEPSTSNSVPSAAPTESLPMPLDAPAELPDAEPMTQASGPAGVGTTGSGGQDNASDPTVGMAGNVNLGGGGSGGGTGGTSHGGTGGAAESAQAGTGGVRATAGADGGAATSGDHTEDVEFCLAQLDAAAEHYEGFLATYTNPSQIPRSVNGGDARLVGPSDWTSGFPAGSLWFLYEHTGSDEYRAAAEAWTDALYGERNRTADHDVGFIIGSSYGNGLRLTGNTDYEAVLVTAAGSLVTRYNANVGAIRSWDFGSWQYPVIIDNMMNLELLWRATEVSGQNSFVDVAVSHANKTLANHFRPDASSYHVLDYDSSNGDVLAKQTNQGLNDESAWARGQAWGLYGYTMAFRESQNVAYLDQAERIADFYTQSDRMPADKIPYFDFDAPILDDVPDHRDVSAGAIATSALLELVRYTAPEVSERYLAFALSSLRSMSTDYRAPLGTNGHFLLMHAVGNYPINDEVDVAINYADYYYLEALLRCTRLE